MSICNDVIAQSLHRGADECESVFCAKRTITVRITDSEISEIKESYDKSIGIRLIKDRKISSAQSNVLDSKKIVEEAFHGISKLSRREFWKMFPSETKFKTLEKTNDYKIWKIDTIKASELAQSMIDATLHKKITRVSGSLNITCDEFEVSNTTGLHRSEKSSYVSGLINADSEIAGSVSGLGQLNSRTFDLFDPQKVGHDAKEMCIKSINPETAASKITSIIFEPHAVGELLYFILGPNFHLKTFSEARSCFTKIGSKISTELLSLIDDPHVPNSLGAKSFDDEGVSTEQRFFIRDGIFEETYSDTYTAQKENRVTSGNACRFGVPLGRSTDPIPVSAPHNLTIVSGNQTHEEIIKNTNDGILVGRLWYTYPVNPLRGDFSCTARSGIFQIKNRQITPIKSIRIIHNLLTMLENISAIGNDSKVVLPWAGLPVTCPTIKCDCMSFSTI